MLQVQGWSRMTSLHSVSLGLILPPVLELAEVSEVIYHFLNTSVKDWNSFLYK